MRLLYPILGCVASLILEVVERNILAGLAHARNCILFYRHLVKKT